MWNVGLGGTHFCLYCWGGGRDRDKPPNSGADSRESVSFGVRKRAQLKKKNKVNNKGRTHGVNVCPRHTNMCSTQTHRQKHIQSRMLLLTGFGALRTKLSLPPGSFGVVSTSPWKNSISILGSKNQGLLSQRGKKDMAGRLGTCTPSLFLPSPLCLIFRLLKPMWKSWAQSTLHLPSFPRSFVYLVKLKDPWWL